MPENTRKAMDIQDNRNASSLSEEETSPESGKSDNLHFKNDRRHRRQLVSCSDALLDNDYLMINCLPTENIVVGAWENVVPCPQYVTNSRKKKNDLLAISSDTSDLTSGQTTVRQRRNYELDFVNCPAWRMGIEPMTYRYMPSNGRYRAFKLARRQDTPKAFKKSFSTSKLSTDARHLQKEIQRELRKEFEMFLSVERQKSSMMRQLEAKQRIQHEKKNQHGTNAVSDLKGNSSGLRAASPHDSVIATPDDSSNPGCAAQDSNAKSKSVPALNMQQLSKEQGEYYLEQVSTRLKEMEKDVYNRVPLKRFEGCLEATGYSKPESEPKQQQTDQTSNYSLNRYRKLPGVNDSATLSLAKTNYNKCSRVVNDDTNCTDQTASGLVTHSAKQPDAKLLDTPRTTLHMPHPLMYYPPDLSRVNDTANPGPALAKAVSKPVNGVQKVGDMSNQGRPFRLVSEYKLRKGSSEQAFDTLDPETFNVIDTIRSSYQLCGSRSEEEVSVESRSTGAVARQCSVTQAEAPSRFVDPRGSNVTPNYEDYARSQVIHRKSYGGRQLDKSQLISDCDFLLTSFGGGEKTRPGAPSILRRPRASRAPLLEETLTVPAPAKTVHDVSGDSSPKLSAHSVRGNIMPEVMIRRAEIAVTSKRII